MMQTTQTPPRSAEPRELCIAPRAGTVRQHTLDSSGESLSNLVSSIRSGQVDGMEELYALFSKWIKMYLQYRLGPQESDDKVHDTFVAVVRAIRRGDVREPERLMAFVRTIVRRLVVAHIDRVVRRGAETIDSELIARIVDPAGNPEEVAIFRERTELIARVLDELSRRDCEILTRFYLDEQGKDQIRSEMGLSGTQFRLLKTRAKVRFGELGKKKLTPSILSHFG
jgi:RNA polymerase sigma-70 factor (ECF subfamily)